MSSRRRRSRKYESNLAGPKCSYCERSLALFTHNIACANCSKLVFCLDCFSVGANKNKTHETTHEYIVEERVYSSVYEEGWTAEDEKKLLDSLAKYGLNEWRLVANEMGTHSAKRCEDHYYNVYINHENSPLPQELDPNGESGTEETSRGTTDTPVSTPKSVKKRKSRQFEDEDERDATDRVTPSASLAGNGKTDDNAQELTGYLPKRGDFEVEYDDKAEHLIADLEIGEDDDNATVELKTQLLELYDLRLREREKVKEMVFEHGIKCVEEIRRSPLKRRAERLHDDNVQKFRKKLRRRSKSKVNVALSSDAPTPNGLDLAP